MRMFPVLCIGIVLFAVPAFASLSTVDVYQDAYIDHYDPSGGSHVNGVFDTNALLAGFGTLSTSQGDIGLESRAVVTFDLNSYLGQDLLDAKLTGFGKSIRADGNPIDVDVYSYNDDGSVTDDDFSRTALSAGALTLPFNGGSIVEPAYFEMNVTSAVKQALANNQRYLEFRFQSGAKEAYITAGQVPFPFESDALGFHDSILKGPQLALNVTPEPVSSALFLLGGGVLAAKLRRRRK